MPTRLLPWLLALLCACARPPLRSGASGEVWVDAAAGQGGDGTRPRPLRSLEEALARPGTARVHLAPGRYAGPFRLPEGLQLRGAGPATVLTARVLEARVLEARAGAVLESLTVEGGGWGLEAEGAVRGADVIFRGQTRGAIHVRAGGLDGQRLRFEAAPGASDPPVGMLVEAGSLRLEDSTFTGPFSRGVRVQGGATARLEGVGFQGPGMALSQQGGTVQVSRTRVSGGAGPAFLVTEGALTLEDVRVQGHEYGVAALGAQVSLRGFTSEHAGRAGLGLTATRGLLEDVVVRDAGSYGAVQLTNGDLELRRFRLEGSREYGVVAVQGRLRLREGHVEDVSTADGAAGDGLHLRQVDADVEAVTVRGARGTCVLATQRAHAVLRDARLSGCGLAALAVDTHAVLEARDVQVRDVRGAVLLASEDGQLQVEHLAAEGARGELVSADCRGATRVQLRDVRPGPERDAPCVQREPAP